MDRPPPTAEIIHASCVSWKGRAVLIEGPSGSGKSTLALSLMAYGADLVADDKTAVWSAKTQLRVSAPPGLPHGIEARGIGVIRAQLVPEARLVLAVDLSETETNRLPDGKTRMFDGQKVALWHKVNGPHFPTAILQYLKCGGMIAP